MSASAGFTRADEGAHQPGQEPLWSETCVMTWWDDHAGVGGVHHIGQEVNQGLTNWWHGIVTRDGECYRSWSESAPLQSNYRTLNRLQVDPGKMVYFEEDGGNYLDFGDTDSQVQLQFSDYYQICEARERGTGGDIERTTSPNHFESSGRATGSVRLRDRVIEIRNAQYHRDHSWGVRDYSRVLGHRWIVGTAGHALSFNAVTIVGPSNFVARGFVVRDGVREQAQDVDIVVGVGPDGTSIRSASVVIGLRDHSQIQIECEPVGGFLWGQRGWLATDLIGNFRTSDGLVGMTCVETSLNTRDGRGPINLAVEVATQDGFSRPHRGILRSTNFSPHANLECRSATQA